MTVSMWIPLEDYLTGWAGNLFPRPDLGGLAVTGHSTRVTDGWHQSAQVEELGDSSWPCPGSTSSPPSCCRHARAGAHRRGGLDRAVPGAGPRSRRRTRDRLPVPDPGDRRPGRVGSGVQPTAAGKPPSVEFTAGVALNSTGFGGISVLLRTLALSRAAADAGRHRVRDPGGPGRGCRSVGERATARHRRPGVPGAAVRQRDLHFPDGVELGGMPRRPSRWSTVRSAPGGSPAPSPGPGTPGRRRPRPVTAREPARVPLRARVAAASGAAGRRHHGGAHRRPGRTVLRPGAHGGGVRRHRRGFTATVTGTPDSPPQLGYGSPVTPTTPAVVTLTVPGVGTLRVDGLGLVRDDDGTGCCCPGSWTCRSGAGAELAHHRRAGPADRAGRDRARARGLDRPAAAGRAGPVRLRRWRSPGSGSAPRTTAGAGSAWTAPSGSPNCCRPAPASAGCRSAGIRPTGAYRS